MASNRRRLTGSDPGVSPSRQRSRVGNDLAEGQHIELTDIAGDQASGASRFVAHIDDNGKLSTAEPGMTGVTRLEIDTAPNAAGIRLFNGAVKTVDLDGLTGNATFFGQITGGSAKFDDDPANNTYVWIQDTVGMRWRRSSDAKDAASANGGWVNLSANDWWSTVEFQARELSGGGDGTAQGREARLALFNQRRTSDPGNNAVSWNASSISLYTRWKTASSLGEISLASVTDTVRRVTMRAEQLFLDAEPSPSTVGNSKYARGTLYYGEATSDVTFTTTQTDIVGGATITAIAGRRYKITCGWPRMLSTVNDDIVAMRVAEAGVGILKEYRYRVGISLGADGATVSAVVAPSAGSHTYKLAGIRSSGTGTITVVGNTGGGEQWILVEDIGHA